MGHHRAFPCIACSPSPPCLEATLVAPSLRARCLTAGSHLLVEGLLLRNAVLPSRQLVDSGLAAPAPLAFNLSSNTSLLLQSCTVSTTCDNLAQFAAWVGGQAQQPSSVNATQVGWKL